MHAADHIWSSNLSPPFVERFMLVDNKTPCDRLINSSSALLPFDVVSFFFFFFCGIRYSSTSASCSDNQIWPNALNLADCCHIFRETCVG
jgi:hypothetical protein